MSRAVLIVVAADAASGCVAKRTPAWVAPALPFGAVSEQILRDLVSAGDYAWQRRAEPGQLDEAARAWGAALRYDPSDEKVLVQLARVALRRASTSRGAGAAERLDEATGYAERALSARNSKLLDAARAGKLPAAVFSLAEPADAPALAVYAEALLGWSLAHGTSTLLGKRAWIEAAAQRALAFDPAVGQAAPNRVLGVLDCELPEAGQNLRDALDRFEAAVAAAPAYLPTRVAYAEEYATRVRDAVLYKRLLGEVLAADANALPAAAPENADAQRAARRLLRGRR
ncbi:MAG TPA: TRAP transporter TatT component family protein [Polyangia bacterium]